MKNKTTSIALWLIMLMEYAYILLVVSLHLLIISCGKAQDACSCGVPDPSFVTGRERVCRVENVTYQDSHRIRLNWYDCVSTEDRYCGIQYDQDACPTFVGMNLTFVCPEGAEIRKDDQIWSNSTLTLLSVQSSDGGVYECILNSGEKAAYNITVSNAGVIGLRPYYCGLNFFSNSHLGCCENTNALSLSKPSIYRIPVPFYAFGATNITLQQVWITSPEDHYPVDLKLGQSPIIDYTFNITFERFPKIVNMIAHNVMAVITAINDFGSNSVCIHLQFDASQWDFLASADLPTNATEGSNTSFECQLETINPATTIGQYKFEYNLTVNGTSVRAWMAKCFIGGDFECVVKQPIRTISVQFSNTSISLPTRNFRFSLTVIDLSAVHDNSAFSCSILSDGVIQWKRTAHLNVSKKFDKEADEDNGRQEQTAIAASVVVLCLVGVAGAVVSLAGFLGVRRLRSGRIKPRRRHGLRPDEVPLTDHTGSQPTVCDSEVNTPVTPIFPGPAIQIVEYGAAVQQDTVVCDPVIPTPQDGGDPGYQSSQSCEDVTNVGYHTALTSRPAPPTSLGLLGTIHSKISKSDSDLYGRHSKLAEDAVSRDDSVRHEKCVVYVSYTDRMANWVRIVLKPMIESWRHSEVVLHEDDMIPGFTVSGERQRLILQAHKVVLVVSRDYSESPWCLYELQHAIQQEPALCRGRVIPILVDGCHELPSIVAGVVSLVENDRNFNSKLRKNIMGY